MKAEVEVAINGVAATRRIVDTVDEMARVWRENQAPALHTSAAEWGRQRGRRDIAIQAIASLTGQPATVVQTALEEGKL